MKPGINSVICIGGAAVDRKYRALAAIRPGTSNPVVSESSFGGVARNVAENMARLGVDASLASMIGKDENGRALLDDLQHLGIDTQFMAVSDKHATAEYVAVLQPDGELAFGLANMEIFDALTPDLLRNLDSQLQTGWIFADCNLPSETLHALIEIAHRQSLTLAIDGVSTPKVSRLPPNLIGVGLLFLNLDEARAYLGEPKASSEEAAARLLACGADRVVLTLGVAGLIVAGRSGIHQIGAIDAEIVDATGAGDALIAATLVALLKGRPLTEAARLGTAAAALTVESTASVRPDLSFALLETLFSLRADPAFEREPS
ncbi:carbohydrate kinase family protein [Microvirga terrestris]|uniref:Carbohydrate kinase family protein n=1 Tax=Microvirga terrestris TaxID=2791024 RepID=A0ABS0HWF1_9HYPH|nr:carbohydrate kinase family protein [Microvirga terrestris]MBF9197789.1 carbohydrate kinase family protein [Microvirga terrestris]